MPRVVSLVPSATETLLAWEVDVVACTRFCEQPDITHVGGTKDPDVAAIALLEPDLVVVDREENRREDAEALTAAGLAVHVMHVTTLDGLGAELDALAAAVGATPTRLDIGRSAQEWSSAAVLIWRRPWMAINGDTYGSTVLAHLGVRNVLADAADRYPTMTLGEISERRPELVLLPSEPYPFRARHLGEIAEALPASCVELIDGQDLFWWGSRTPGALARLREALRAATRRS